MRIDAVSASEAGGRNREAEPFAITHEIISGIAIEGPWEVHGVFAVFAVHGNFSTVPVSPVHERVRVGYEGEGDRNIGWLSEGDGFWDLFRNAASYANHYDNKRVIDHITCSTIVCNDKFEPIGFRSFTLTHSVFLSSSSLIQYIAICRIG